MSKSNLANYLLSSDNANESEANSVRHIYNRYTELRNVRLLKTDLDRDGYVSKLRTRKTGIQAGGKPIERGALYTLLKNRTSWSDYTQGRSV